MNRLRLLSVDDILLLRLLLEGGTVTSTAVRLGLTQPAVTQRIRKIERVFECKLFERSGRGVRLTDAGHAVCESASAALSLLEDVSDGPREQVINIGTRPEVGFSWVWPALSRLRKSAPHTVYHCTFGSGEEILRLLAAGTLDAVITSAPHAVRGYGASELAEERYVFAAAPEIAGEVKTTGDLEQFILVEHDRSFPFQRYIEAAARAQMRYRDVWFVGSTVLMTNALVEGLGVGVVPEYLAAGALARGRLVRLLPRIRIESDYFRLVYRQEKNLGSAIQPLEAALKKIGLR